VDGAVLDRKQVGALALMPPKPVLQATLLGLLASPLRGFARVLAANPSGFVRVLSAREKQLAESAS
jgi:ribosomal protein L10